MKVTTIQFNKPIYNQSNPNSHIRKTNPIENNFSSEKNFTNLNLQQGNYIPTFKGEWFEDNIVKNIQGKEYYGAGLYSNNNFIDFNKVGWAKLSKENFDITKATDIEIYAFQHALALAETVDTSWVQRFNPFNVDLPLATSHTLCDKKSRELYAKNLKVLLDKSKNPELDEPVFNKKGELILDCIVWDTETTGTNATNSALPLDKIVQIGSIQIKKGKVAPETAYKQLINPRIPIPEPASLVHNIYDKDVADKPTMNEILPKYLKKHLNKKNGVIVAYNSKFDMSILNNAIETYNKENNKSISSKPLYNILDPFIITQRIHPYLGAKKKLGEQYKYLFCKNLDDAHDAFADVKGTVDILKYDLYYLNNHRKDKSKPLTLREVLLFQNGYEPENIGIKLNHMGCNDNVNFKMSYRLKPVNVFNYFKGYRLREDKLLDYQPVIGEKNVQKLKNIIIPPSLLDETDEGVLEAEITDVHNHKKKRTIYYTQNRNFKKILKFADIQSYGDLTKSEVFDYITEQSKNYIENKSIDLIYKNCNPRDIKKGNDMPDIKIAQKVMREKTV